jgi:hypothetical protein
VSCFQNFVASKFFNDSLFLDFQQNTFNTNGGQRLSPQQQQLNQQLINNFQQGNGSSANNTSQLSPRQPPYNIQQTSQAQGNQSNWNQQSNAIRVNSSLLNAQLSVCDILN